MREENYPGLFLVLPWIWTSIFVVMFPEEFLALKTTALKHTVKKVETNSIKQASVDPTDRAAQIDRELVGTHERGRENVSEDDVWQVESEPCPDDLWISRSRQLDSTPIVTTEEGGLRGIQVITAAEGSRTPWRVGLGCLQSIAFAD